jgi:hypothetical protein
MASSAVHINRCAIEGAAGNGHVGDVTVQGITGLQTVLKTLGLHHTGQKNRCDHYFTFFHDVNFSWVNNFKNEMSARPTGQN